MSSSSPSHSTTIKSRRRSLPLRQPRTAKKMTTFLVYTLLFLLITTPNLVNSECTCDASKDTVEETHNNSELLHLKLAAFFSILILGGIGVSIPMLGKRFELFKADKNLFFLIKAFAGGVILATGFIHVLPDAFESLTSPCLNENPWSLFPFTGFFAMVAAIGSLIIDSLSISYFENRRCVDDVESSSKIGVSDNAHGHGYMQSAESELIKHRVNSYVLELGIIVHSVIIGISLGASVEADTIKPLVIAIAFHQFFEGMGLGGCIFQAKFKIWKTVIMALFFALTTPIGILIGMKISNSYDENSPTALKVGGSLNAASSGILIYMALVDLLSPAFAHPKMKRSFVLQFVSYLSLLIGAGSMSLIAKWA